MLAAVAGVFNEQGVSVETVLQSSSASAATLVIVTHLAPESALAGTVEALRSNDVVRDVTSVLRVEGL
ncbi:hypothetical protein GCM10025874_01470 [Arenivirga flava]|uniref:ACT domain-containing protein n=1 Tax=Arenivirga flava TaxID=1930060 RepID=A0AA37X7Z1_9MICO|nr:hypothetical protein GCM10025874_01470 [Arenivirga flava]